MHLPKKVFETEQNNMIRNIMIYKSFLLQEPNLVHDKNRFNNLMRSISNNHYRLYLSQKKFAKALQTIRNEFLEETIEKLTSKEITDCIQKYTSKLLDGRFIILDCIYDELEELVNKKCTQL